MVVAEKDGLRNALKNDDSRGCEDVNDFDDDAGVVNAAGDFGVVCAIDARVFDVRVVDVVDYGAVRGEKQGVKNDV